MLHAPLEFYRLGDLIVNDDEPRALGRPRKELNHVGPEPCIGCACWLAWKHKRLACLAFLEYARSNAWTTPPGAPLRCHYLSLFDAA